MKIGYILLFYSLFLLGPSSFAALPVDLKFDLVPLLQASDGEDVEKFTSKYLKQMYQYFEYQFDEKNQLILNQEISLAHKIQFEKNDDKTVSIDITDKAFNGLKIAFYGKKNLSSDKMTRYKMKEKKDNKFIYYSSDDDSVFCLALKNRFTVLNICRDQKIIVEFPNRVSTDPIVLVNDVAAEKVGLVLLQNYEKEIRFSVQYEELERIEYSVIKRLPLIRKIMKSAQSEKVSLNFFDFRVENSKWNDEILLNKNFIQLKLNTLVPVRQQIAFSNLVQKETLLNDLDNSSQKSKDSSAIGNKRFRHRRFALGIESSLYTRTDQIFAMGLLSKNALSLQFMYQQNLLSNNSIDYSLDYTQYKIVQNAENISVAGGESTRYFLQVGYRWLLFDYLQVSSGLGLLKSSFYKSAADLTSIGTTSAQLISVPLKAIFVFNMSKTSELQIPIEYIYLMGGDQISSGSIIGYGAELIQDFSGSNYFLGFKSMLKNQKYFEFDQNEDHFQIYGGLLF